MTNFRELLNRIAEQFPSRDAFAKAIGMNASRLSRALNTGDYPFNVTNCLRLAKLSGENPSDVLRAAGKANVAELIESLYGRDRNALLDDQERRLLTRWQKLDPEMRETLLYILDGLTQRQTGKAVSTAAPFRAHARDTPRRIDRRASKRRNRGDDGT